MFPFECPHLNNYMFRQKKQNSFAVRCLDFSFELLEQTTAETETGEKGDTLHMHASTNKNTGEIASRFDRLQECVLKKDFQTSVVCQTTDLLTCSYFFTCHLQECLKIELY